MSGYFKVKGKGPVRYLKGEIRVNGAKNSVLKAISASLLFDSDVIIENAPHIVDLCWLLEILEKLGVQARFDKNNNKILIKRFSEDNLSYVLDFDLAKRLRSSIVLTGPLLARKGRVVFPYPGGDKIGLRPIDLFLEGYKKMGATVKEFNDKIEVSAENLHGAEIFFRRQSVTATEALMMAAVLAEGKTLLKNAAMEPEIKHLADFLNKSGAKIDGAGTHTITIHGSYSPLRTEKSFLTPPDRIEAGSFLALSSVLADNVLIKACAPSEMEAVLEYFDYIGLNFDVGLDCIHIHNNKESREFIMRDFVTHEYPGFPTDMQAPIVVSLTQFSGEAIIFETIFEDRFAYTEALRLMGADILSLDPHRILVRGPRKLFPRNLKSIDIRAGMAQLMAAAFAYGESKIFDIYHIERGYANIDSRLKGIGLDIQRC